jgi:hypothetical protein
MHGDRKGRHAAYWQMSNDGVTVRYEANHVTIAHDLQGSNRRRILGCDAAQQRD